LREDTLGFVSTILKSRSSQLEAYIINFASRANYDYRHKSIVLANEAIAIPEFPVLSLQLSSIFPQ